jgi:hypothetical protein
MFHQAHVTVYVCISENISLDCKGGKKSTLNFLPLRPHTLKVLSERKLSSQSFLFQNLTQLIPVSHYEFKKFRLFINGPYVGNFNLFYFRKVREAGSSGRAV